MVFWTYLTILSKAKSGMTLHKIPELLPQKDEKGVPFFIDYNLKGCIKGWHLKITLSGRKRWKVGCEVHQVLIPSIMWRLKITERKNHSKVEPFSL
jgi:hypothetical protein